MVESNSSPTPVVTELLAPDRIREIPDTELGRLVLELNTSLRQAHAIAMSAGSMTVRYAVAMGQIFQEAFRRHQGEFGEWLRAAVGEDPEGNMRISVETARRWRTLYEKRDRLFPVGEEAPECRTMTEAYIKVGLLPAPAPDEHPNAGQKIFRLTFTAPAVSPEEMPAADRREFMVKAEPIVQLYEKLKVIADAA